jgi:hypothetical protein
MFYPLKTPLFKRLNWLIALLIIIGSYAYPQSSPNNNSEKRRMAVTVISDSIVIDGKLDEAVWKSTPTIGDLIQRQPDPGTRPSERTDVTLLRNADYLYIGVVAYDSEPDKINRAQMSRDASLSSDDRLEILLDTFRDQQSAFYFATNPNGALVDGLVFGTQDLNTDWNAICGHRLPKKVGQLKSPFRLKVLVFLKTVLSGASIFLVIFIGSSKKRCGQELALKIDF